ncbi:TolB family protein [Methanolobus chelungpuianus]|uniref:TolB family protein n=1 Tax=Methanolobus chelungpuianus TaxID=502115 RepID=UPI00211532EB|nr:DPP IV N-terminal domain-containing protein [Methanolobus chelungpuianus]
MAVAALVPLAYGAGDIIVDEELQLTRGSNCNHPSWSPDGRKLVYAYDQGIWMINPDGSGATKLYSTLSWIGEPVFDPSGTKIYYATESKTTYSARYVSLHVMNADGSDNVKLTGTSDCRDPSVSPDGRSIAYLSKLAGNYDIWVMDVNTRKSVQVTDSKGDESSPSWSPDGTRLIYSFAGDIYTQEPDAAKAVRLTDDGFNNIEPSYSPDGDMIVFSSDRDGSYDLWIMHADGTHMKKLTMDRSSERAPVWSPDGNWIAYISNSAGEFNMWALRMRMESTDQVSTVTYAPEEKEVEVNPYVHSVRSFAMNDPKKFIISVLLISFVVVSGIVYSFLRKIR